MASLKALATPSAGEFLSPNWVQASPATKPAGLVYAAMAYDPVRNQVVMFGGEKADGSASNQTWVWNGTAWSLKSPATSPAARARANMAWDPVAQRLIMFGGQTTSTTVSNQVWSWDGTTWTQLTPTGTAPAARAGSAMAYDPVRQAMIVFGGITAANAPLNDTWQLKNNAWTQIQANGATGAPAARYELSMSYSTSTSQLVIFGGGSCPTASACVTFNDTWILDSSSSSWSQQSPAHVPAKRGAFSMTFDPGLNAVVMFGGIDNEGSTATLVGDTWAWTGTDWAQAVGIASPSGRGGQQMAAMSSGQVVMFGGAIVGPEVLDETWTYDTSLPVVGVSVTHGTTPAEGTDPSLYWAGESVNVELNAANAGVNPITGVSLTSALQDALSPAGSLLTLDGAELSACDGSTATCGSIADLTTTISNLSIPVGSTRLGDFVATIVGTQRGCELVDVPAIASLVTGQSAEVFSQLTVCGGGLGMEDWWTYDTTDLGQGDSANVNVANGNLVVQANDTDPVQSQGRLALGLGRVYNSQDLMSAGGPIGAGWQFDIGDTGETAGGFGIGGLKLPNLQTVLQPLSMPYIDRDGTRHVFRLRSIAATLGDVTLPIDLTGQQGTTGGILSLLNPATLPFTLTSAIQGLEYTNLCVDEAYTGPPGTNMFLFRYVGMGANDCKTPGSSGRLTIGWSLVRPDRVRYDFNALGDLIAVTDPSGQQLVYKPGVTYGPTEIYTKACGDTGACPKVTIDYNAGSTPSGFRQVKVTDTAGRVTSYIVTTDAVMPELTQVWQPGNPYPGGTVPDGVLPTESYTYSTSTTPCPGSGSGALTVGQLCSVIDASGHATTFAYTKAPLGPDRVLKVTDRQAQSGVTTATDPGVVTAYAYSDPSGTDPATLSGPPTYVTADMGSPSQIASCGSSCERIRYSHIDDYGRVGEIDEGNSADTYLRQTGYFWDGLPNGPDGNPTDMGGIASCSQPSTTMNHNLCRVIRRAVPSTTAFQPGVVGTATQNSVTVSDAATDYQYGDLGQKLRQRVLLDASQPWTDTNSSITTWGTTDQYFDANGNQRAYNNHVIGSGGVTSSAAGTNYPTEVKRDNPVDYWRLGESSGTTMTAAVGQNGAYGSVVLGQPGVIGDNTALTEAPAAAGAAVSSLNGFANGTGASSAFTIEAWEKTTDTTAQETTFSWGGSSSQYGLVGRNYGGLPMIYLASDATTSKTAVVYATTSIADGNWHHVVYTYDGSGHADGMAIWVDGVQQALTKYSDTLAGSYAPAPVFAQAARGGTSGQSSQLDELALYTHVLSPARIKAHYTEAQGGDRVTADTLYAVTDTTQMLTPRGNSAGNASHWGDFLTTYRRDLPADGSLASTNAVADPTHSPAICGSAARGNTGLLCEADTPASADVNSGFCTSPTVNLPAGSPAAPTSNGYTHTCSTYEYNGSGQRTLMRSPNANSASSPAATTYAYYDDTTSCSGTGQENCDLSGTVSAGGWLKAVTDPAGEKTIFAYDAAGNLARTWDRNATHGTALGASWTSTASPPSGAYTETTYGTPVTSDSLSVSNTGLIAVAPDGTIRGAGTNTAGELGSGDTTAHTGPTTALAMSDVVQVAQSATGAAAGCATTLFLTGAGEVWETGSGNTSSTPKKLTGLSDVISIAAGGCHYFALDAEGRLYGWGTNSVGQVGTGGGTTVANPTQVLDHVSTMAAGYLHSLAVTTDGKLWTWGGNSVGQLGSGNTTAHSTPTEITSLTDVRSLSAGAYSSYAIRRDGTVWAWGDNSGGALGDGTSTQRTTPTKIPTLGPTATAGPVRQIVGTAYGAAALMSDGTVRAWGVNNYGQLGNGTTTGSSSVPVAVPGLSGQRAIAGGYVTYASAGGAGVVRVWGGTGANQRADGTAPATTTTPTVAGVDLSPFRTPGPVQLSSRDAVGNLTTTTVDRLNNTRRTRRGRGNEIYTAAFDTTTGYDADGRPTWTSGAQHRDTTTTASTTYDAYGNAIKHIDAAGIATRATYDTVNRQSGTQATRGPATDPTGDDATTLASCPATATSGDFTAGQAGDMVCTTSTTYDGIDQQITTTDGNVQVVRTTYDSAGRAVAVSSPRNDGSYTTLTTRTLYDRDGNTTDACPPSDAAACDGNAVHSTHIAYDNADRPATQTRYRAAYNPGTVGSGSQTTLTTSYAYDGDGNQTAVTDPNGHTTTTTYDFQDRKTSQAIPRNTGVKETTTWSYDYSGNVIDVIAPGSLNTGSGADGSITIDGTTAANSTDNQTHGSANPFQIPDGAQYRDVTLQNGAYVTAGNAHGLLFHAAGTVSVCSTCVITMVGKGQTGGGPGNGQPGGTGISAANPNPGNGGTGGQGGLLDLAAAGGGGGAHKNDGQPGLPATTSAGLPGLASGSSDFADVGSDYLAGSGGGGGGGGVGLLGNAGTGGNGGGYIHITANKITVDGTITAAGTPGTAGSTNSGGGGGGAGGGIWLAAPTITLNSASVLNVNGAAGGTGAGSGDNQKNGGNGSDGLIRIDSDNVTNAPTGANLTKSAMVTAVSYDAANRPIDTVDGAEILAAATNTGSRAAPDPDGYSNTRTRVFYNADNQTVAQLPPTAFNTTASITAPNVDVAKRIDYDLDGQPVRVYSPRYSTNATSQGSGDDGGTGANQQTSQCLTAPVTDAVNGLASYGSSVGVCVARTTYDADDRVQNQYLPSSNGSDNAYLTYSYTGDGLTRTVSGPDPTDPSGAHITTATYRYDGDGRSIQTTDANGNKTKTVYTADGLVDHTIGQGYTNPTDGSSVTLTTSYGYDADGHQTKTTNPKGDQTTQAWTTDGLPASITAPGPSAGTTAITRYGYDNNGNATKVLQPKAEATGGARVVNDFTFDNLVSATYTPITASSYRTVRYSYAPAGMKVATETARCASATLTDCVPGNGAWNSAGNQRITYGANGRVATQVGRDPAGPGASRAIATTYTQDGHAKSVNDPTSSSTITADYYLDGELRSVIDNGGGDNANANTNTYAYDASGQLTVRTDKTGAGGTTGVTSGATITTSYAYNAAGLLSASKSGVLGATTSYSFDKGGRLLTATTGGHTDHWSWEPDNTLAGAQTTDSSTTIAQYDYVYDNNQNITKQLTTGSVGGATSTWTYAPGQQVTGWSFNPVSGNPAGSDAITATWAYDKNNNRTTSTVKTGPAATPTTSTTTWSYRLDNSIDTTSNTTSGPGGTTSYTHNSTYNDAGLTLSDGCSTYTYDTFDRVASNAVNNTTACGGDSHTTTYSYDGLDRQRTSALTGSSKSGANVTTKNAYDGLTTSVIGQINAVNGAHTSPNVLYQLDPSGVSVAYSQTTASAGKAFLDTDGQGNVTAITTGDGTGTGALGCGVVYDAYGVPQQLPTSGTTNNGVCENGTGTVATTTGNAAWYRGLTRDGNNGTYQLGTRTYNPGTGSFTTPDSFRVADPATDLSVGVDPLLNNTYAYVNGNPLNLWDPSGHRPVECTQGSCVYHGVGGGTTANSTKAGTGTTARSSNSWLAAYKSMLKGDSNSSRRPGTVGELLTGGLRKTLPPAPEPPPEEHHGFFHWLASRTINLPSLSCLVPQIGSRGQPLCNTDGVDVTVGELASTEWTLTKSILLPDWAACIGKTASALKCTLEVASFLPLPTKALKLRKLEKVAEALRDTERVADDAATALNRAGRPYPDVPDPRTGSPIHFPGEGLSRVPVSERVPWGGKERGAFIKEWYDRGYDTPEGGWSGYDIHHIRPREYGGTNNFDNLVPVPREVHQQLFNTWWRDY